MSFAGAVDLDVNTLINVIKFKNIANTEEVFNSVHRAYQKVKKHLADKEPIK